MDIATFAVVAATIIGAGVAVLFILACLGRAKREAVTAVLFWTVFLCVIAVVPVLIKVTVYAYGLMLAIAVILCTALLVCDARAKKVKADVIFDLVFWVMVGGIIGARLFFIGMHYAFFLEHPGEIVMLQNGGLAWQGGLFLGMISGIALVRRRKLSLPMMLDLCAPYLALGQAIGRIGCFLNGCCYGKPVAWGIYFPVHDAALHPTQLYLSAGMLLIFLILKRYQRSSRIPGLVFASYLILASTLRFVVEFFRADAEILFFGFTIFQFVSAGFLLFAFLFAYVMVIRNSGQGHLR